MAGDYLVSIQITPLCKSSSSTTRACRGFLGISPPPLVPGLPVAHSHHQSWVVYSAGHTLSNEHTHYIEAQSYLSWKYKYRLKVACAETRRKAVNVVRVDNIAAGNQFLDLMSFVFFIPCYLNYVRIGPHRPTFLPIRNRATPTSAAKLTKEKEKAMPGMRGGLFFVCHMYPASARA